MDERNGVSRRDRFEAGGPDRPPTPRRRGIRDRGPPVPAAPGVVLSSLAGRPANPANYDGDGLFHQILVKGMIEHGWYLNNKSLGAPLGLQMHDFPMVDALFFVLLKLISLPSRDWGLTVNLFYFLTFPLTTVTALSAMHRLGVSYAPALVGALLYTFLPYHFTRGESHLYLSCYFLVPLIVPVVVRILLGRGVPLRREGPDGVVRWDLTSRESLRRGPLPTDGLGRHLLCLLLLLPAAHRWNCRGLEPASAVPAGRIMPTDLRDRLECRAKTSCPRSSTTCGTVRTHVGWCAIPTRPSATGCVLPACSCPATCTGSGC